MKILAEMVKSLKLYHYPNTLQVLGKYKATSNQITKFYEGIKSGKFTTDAEASAEILGCDPKKQPYRDLKVKLKNRVINTLFFIDPKKLKVNVQYHKNVIYCEKRWVAVKILNGIGAKSAAVEIASRVLIRAQKAQLNSICADISLYLSYHYGALVGDQKKFEYYIEIFTRHSQIRIWEDKAQEYYTRLALYYIKNKAEKSVIREQAQSFYEEIEPHIYTFKTYKLIFFGGLMKLITYMSVNDYKNSIEVCNETLLLMDTNPLFPTLGKATFMHQQLLCCIQLKLFDEGERLATNALAYLKPGFFNWFKHQELFFLLSTHTKNYERAYEIVRETFSTKGFNNQNQNLKEVWKIYDMYTKYLIGQDKIVIPDSGKKKIRLGKFLNEVPTYSQDKRGLNIPILIIQILIYIQRKDFDAAINRIEAIEKYCSRYLRKDNDFRSNCFIKMILQLPHAHFHPAAALRKAEKYYDKLKTQPIDVANQAYSIEIIPYEDLWEIAIGSLGKKGQT